MDAERGPIRILAYFAASLFALTLIVSLGFWWRSGQLIRELEEFGRLQEIKIIWTESLDPQRTIGGERYEGEPIGRLELWRYAPVLLEELGVYPPASLHQLGLEKIVLVKSLTCQGRSIGGVSFVDRKTIFLDVPSKRFDQWRVCRAIHHEIFHLCDRGGEAQDLEWENLNPPGFKYDWKRLNAHWEDLFPLRGFVDAYSLCHASEDKAEVFAYLVFRPKLVNDAADPMLRQKFDLMKKRINGLRIGIDNAFWKAMENRPLAAGDWMAEAEDERARLEPPHPRFEPVGRVESEDGGVNSGYRKDRAKQEQIDIAPFWAPL